LASGPDPDELPYVLANGVGLASLSGTALPEQRLMIVGEEVVPISLVSHIAA